MGHPRHCLSIQWRAKTTNDVAIRCHSAMSFVFHLWPDQRHLMAGHAETRLARPKDNNEDNVGSPAV